MDYNFFYNH